MSLAFNRDQEHGPALPVVVITATGGFNPGTLTEDVSDGHSPDVCDGTRGRGEWDEKPIVGIDKAKLDHEKFGEIGRIRLYVTEVGAAVLELPPTSVGHAVKRDLCGQHSERRWSGWIRSRIGG